jgi:mycothiol system anti-sigma-R factor
MSVHEHGPGCRDLAARLSEYLDHEIDPGACAEIEGHLDDCPPCRDFLESLRRTVGLVREAAPSAESIPDDVKKRILEAYRRVRSERGD